MLIYISLLTLLAFGLRVFRVGVPVFKEDEYDALRSAVYVNECRVDPGQCRHQTISLKSRLVSLVTNNETRPNLFAEIYKWDFIKDKATVVHNVRAWPHTYLVAWFYRLWGVSEFSSRLPSIIFGSLIVPVGYFFAYYFTGSKKRSLLYSLILAIAFPLIDISRFNRMYPIFITLFLLATYLWHRLLAEKHPQLLLVVMTLVVTLLAYWLQSLTLLLLIGVYIYSALKKRRAFLLLTAVLIIYATAGFSLGIDFFRKQYLNLAWPPHWQYLSFPVWLGLAALFLARQKYLLVISGTYLITVTFFTNRAPGAAYVLALWPIVLLGLVSWRKWLAAATVICIFAQFAAGFNYLYSGRDGRAQITQAYRVILDDFQPGDKIYAVQLRDYYLQDLASETEVIDLQKDPAPEFTGSGWVVWEEEKTGHLNPETLEFIKTNFYYLGRGGVEIYRYNTLNDSQTAQ
jgi:hypothetical protein